jgi:hypothetical protein
MLSQKVQQMYRPLAKPGSDVPEIAEKQVRERGRT